VGTNYYLRKNVCEHCGRGDKDKHIGKASYGWCFSLHVIPEDGINTLDDWKREFGSDRSQIVNEYGESVDASQMLDIITKRKHPKPPGDSDFYRHNSAVPGPNNLARHRIDGRHCVGHGEGTWDYITGEFS